MATLFITCGVQGAGKTTLAKRIEKEHQAIRLTPDDWLRELFPAERSDVSPEIRAAMEALHWSMALRALEVGCNVVLDFGLWAREERDRFRSEAQAIGARVILLLLDPPREELVRRLVQRNAEAPPGVFQISEDDLDRALTFFQLPTTEELRLFDSVP